MFLKNYCNISDEELMIMVGKKDQKAFSELYDRYADRLVNYFYRMLWQDREKAQDFAQDLFTKLIHKPHLYDGKRAFKTWMFSIANNMCKNEYRKQEVRKNTSYEVTHDVAGETGTETERAIDRTAFAEHLNEALTALDETKRSTFEMRYREELSIKEISVVMECSEGTVKSRLFYTLKILNEKLKVYEGIGLMFILIQILFE
ncbi:MAG: RNA polymerase sigma factor [Flavobacteriales bacterium]|nr:RNA polymerase sigma factor [Flavobacteriales bacterium]